MSHNLHEISGNYIESMISNVKDMKAIIFDSETQVIFSLEFSKSLALKQEIFLFKSIDNIQIDQILNDKDLYKKMSESAKKIGIIDSNTRIYQEIERLLGE